MNLSTTRLNSVGEKGLLYFSGYTDPRGAAAFAIRLDRSLSCPIDFNLTRKPQTGEHAHAYPPKRRYNIRKAD